MKNIAAWIMIVALGGWFIQHSRHKVHRSTPLLSSAGSAVQEREFAELFDSNTPLADLAASGKYTVVEVYLDNCGYCRELEAGFARFLEKRKDVALVRVHRSEHMQLKVDGKTREEQQKSADAINAKIKAYDQCGSPHVEVYGPDRQELARDRCSKREGTAYVWDWIAAETGVRPRQAVGY